MCVWFIWATVERETIIDQLMNYRVYLFSLCFLAVTWRQWRRCWDASCSWMSCGNAGSRKKRQSTARKRRGRKTIRKTAAIRTTRLRNSDLSVACSPRVTLDGLTMGCCWQTLQFSAIWLTCCAVNIHKGLRRPIPAHNGEGSVYHGQVAGSLQGSQSNTRTNIVLITCMWNKLHMTSLKCFSLVKRI